MLGRAATILSVTAVAGLITVAPAFADSTITIEPASGAPGSRFTLTIQADAPCSPGADAAFEVFFAPPGIEEITRAALIQLGVTEIRPEDGNGMSAAVVSVPRVKPGTYGVYWSCPTTGATTEGGSSIWGIDETNGVPEAGPLTYRVRPTAPDTSTSDPPTADRGRQVTLTPFIAIGSMLALAGALELLRTRTSPR